jgi:hypothetical protein
MHNNKSVFLGITLVACGYINPVLAIQLPCEAKLAETAIPQNLFFLPESQTSQLQKERAIILSKSSICPLLSQLGLSR